ncbi:MAG: DUF2156 domain-containing protein, partial [Clostridia bacterium]|nr:DUF2156 domain-containing protein [Clostridia bacterium]
MINFHKPEISDKSWVRERLSARDDLTCEYSFSNIFSYTAKMRIEIADVDGFLVSRCFIDGTIGYCYPVGKGDIKAVISLIIEDMKLQSEPCFLFGVGNNEADELNALFGGVFDLKLDRDGFDYIYKSEDLINLSGKKYQPKRNHISFFKKNYNWSYESMSEENVEDCYNMNVEWLKTSGSFYSEELERELQIIRCVFENFSSLDCKGAVLRVDGKVVAFAMGAQIRSDTFCVHFEKAFSN